MIGFSTVWISEGWSFFFSPYFAFPHSVWNSRDSSDLLNTFLLLDTNEKERKCRWLKSANESMTLLAIILRQSVIKWWETRVRILPDKEFTLLFLLLVSFPNWLNFCLKTWDPRAHGSLQSSQLYTEAYSLHNLYNAFYL